MTTEATALATSQEDYDFAPHAREHMTKFEQERRALGWAVAWIDTHPKWISIVHWSWPKDWDGFPRCLTDPVTPCRRTWRFTLIGGGQIRITEHWTNRQLYVGDLDHPWEEKTTLAVSAHTAEGLRIYRGELDGAIGEMPCSTGHAAAASAAGRCGMKSRSSSASDPTARAPGAFRTHGRQRRSG